MVSTILNAGKTGVQWVAQNPVKAVGIAVGSALVVGTAVNVVDAQKIKKIEYTDQYNAVIENYANSCLESKGVFQTMKAGRTFKKAIKAEAKRQAKERKANASK